MTANENREADRPAWAVGLNLSPELARVSDEVLTGIVRWPSVEEWSIARRLADAEMEAARLKDALITLEEEWSALTGMTLREAIEQAHGRVEHEDPYSLVDYFTEKLGAAVRLLDRGEPDFLVDADKSLWCWTEPGRYALPGGSSRPRAYVVNIFGPVTEVWK